MDPSKYEYREEELSEVSEIKSEVSHVALSEDTQDHDEQGFQDFLNTQKKSMIKNQVSKVIAPQPGQTESDKDSADEFIRNFFINYGYAATLDAFQREFFKKKTEGGIPKENIPKVPDIYLQNQNKHHQLYYLEKEYDDMNNLLKQSTIKKEKLTRQKNFYKMHHRRVQQEKAKLNSDIDKLKKKTFEGYQKTYKELSDRYEAVVKEKMLIKLDKEKLISRCQTLEHSLEQLQESIGLEKEKGEKEVKVTKESKKTISLKKKGEPSPIPTDIQNPYKNKQLESINPNMGLNKTYKGHLQAVTAVAFSPKKEIIATGSDDSTWKLWTSPKGELIMCGEGHADWISSVAFHPRGTHLATASGDCSVKVWDFVGACCCMTLMEHSQAVWSVDYHFSGNFLISGSMDQSIKLWDLCTESRKFSFRGHVDSVNCVRWVPFSNALGSASADKTLSLWDIRTNLCTQTFYGHTNAVNSLIFNLAGDLMASGDADGIVRLWDLRTGKQLNNFDCGEYSVNCLCIDNAGTFLTVGSDDTNIRVINLNELKIEEHKLQGHDDSVLSLALSPDNKFLISGGSDATFRIWNA